jgi:tRNA pseudouridine32 synthase/23S rRNA pseudouridine746 synthase
VEQSVNLIDAPLPAAERLVHVDDHLLVWDKPSGLHTVPAKPPGTADCLEARAKAAWTGALLVHRLDRDTSGIVVMARTRLAQRHLGWQFERRQVAKVYVARVAGEVAGDAGRIDLPLICDWPNRPRQMVCHARGKAAVTDWQVIGREAGETRVALRPLTGRSHQLRVHLAALGHPILGDPLYGDAGAAERMQLHALTIGFRHPDGGRTVEFEAALPF